MRFRDDRFAIFRDDRFIRLEENGDEAKRIEVFRVNSEGGSRRSLIIIYRIFE